MADNFRPEDEVQGQVSTEPSEMQQFIEAYMADHPHASPLDAIAAYQCQQESTPQALKARIQKNLSKPICGMRMGAAIDPRSGPTTADSGELDQGLLASFPKLTRARRKEVAVMPYWEDQQAALYLLDREFPRAWDHQGLNSFNSIVRCPATCPEIADSLEWVERQGSTRRSPQEWCELWKQQMRPCNSMIRRATKKTARSTLEERDIAQEQIDDRKLEPREVRFVKFMLSFRRRFPTIPDAVLVQLNPVKEAALCLEGGSVAESTLRRWLRKYYRQNSMDGSQWDGRPSKDATVKLREELGALWPTAKHCLQEQAKSKPPHAGRKGESSPKKG